MLFQPIDPWTASRIEDAIERASRAGDWGIWLEYSSGKSRWVSLGEARHIAWDMRGGDDMDGMR